MTKSSDKASPLEQSGQQTPSVLDFLYHDAQRIGSFLAQFDPSGHLQQIRHTEASLEESGDDRKTTIGFDLKLVRAEMAGGGGTRENSSTGAERVYDPLWSNALKFLAVLQERGLLKENLGTATLGQFVTVSGQLTIVDTEFHHQLYADPIFKKRAIKNALTMKSDATGKLNVQQDVEVELSVLTRLRPQLQAFLACPEGTAFCNMKAVGLVTAPHDLLMKYGSGISGTWTVVGIKDANPEIDAGIVNLAMQDAVKMLGSGNKFLPEYFQMATHLRLWVGRPVSCYGVTPLAVFRKIGHGD